MEWILLSRFENWTKIVSFYTVCNGEQSFVGIVLGDRNETHSDGDDVVLNVDDNGEDDACGIGRIGEIGSVSVVPSKWRKIKAI